jgi:4-hydroxybenzoate polyprenyltransferase
LYQDFYRKMTGYAIIGLMLHALLKTMRPKQWAKNGFLFAALIFDKQLLQPNAFLRTLAGFVLFCLLSSAVYIINDLADIKADRNHPKKRFRPIASGTLPLPVAYTAAIVLPVIIFPLAYLLSPWFALIALIYLLINIAYSTRLKHIPILDVIVLASLYVVRVGAGVELIKVARFSPWLYVFTTFLALYLGVGKRRSEMNLLANGNNTFRPVLQGYTVQLLDQMITIVSCLTIVTYSLYTFSAENLPLNHTMMLTIPFLIYGIFRYLYLLEVEHYGGEPEEVLLTDRPLQVTIALFGLSIFMIFYLF